MHLARKGRVVAGFSRCFSLAAVARTMMQPAVPPTLAGVLDVRSRESFLALHRKGAAHMPVAEINDRLFELPPPQGGPDEPPVVLQLVHELEEAGCEAAVGLLTAKGYCVNSIEHGRDLAARHAEDTLQSGKSYNVLWRPNPALLKCWDSIKEETRSVPRRACLDLAAGNGRDCIFVAREGWHVLGIDYQERQWSKIDALTARVKQEMSDEELARFGSVRSNNLDLETAGPSAVADAVLQLLNGELATLLIVSRYLHRPIHPHLHKFVAPGGFLLFHTFMDGAQHVGRKTPTKPRFLLAPGELRECFGAHFDVVEDSVLLLADQRPTSCFLARRKAE